MHSNSPKRRAADRVYLAIKARVVAYGFEQGERIYLDPIAKALGVSTMPVRDAMNRLAAERLVITEPLKGFIAISLSEENLTGQYELTRSLLTVGLDRLEPPARRKLAECEPIAVILNKLDRCLLSNAISLAHYTGELFALIASLTEKPAVALAINRANDHLYYVRTLECQRLTNVQDELAYFCELLLANRCEELASAIHVYVDRRIALLPALVDREPH